MSDEFILDPNLCHLNHAAVGPWPKRTAEAVQNFAIENARQGSFAYLEWLAMEERLRERLARLIGATSPRDIAFARNTSEALSTIACGQPWQSGDSIVGIVQEFPSNKFVWQSLASRGVHWRGLDLRQSTGDPEDALFALCDDSTRLMAVSWVQYGSGLRLDLTRLGHFCRNHGILLCVDGIQGLGALPFDLQQTPVDFLVADGHKWMMGPEGLGLLYVSPAQRPRLQLQQFGWHMVENPGDFDQERWTPAADARRFECGSPNMLGMHALEASLSLLEELGMEHVWQELQKRTTYLIQAIDHRGWELLTPREPARRAGIVTFRVPGVPCELLYSELMKQQVLCAYRGGGIRFSPHFHTPMDIIDTALARVDGISHSLRHS